MFKIIKEELEELSNYLCAIQLNNNRCLYVAKKAQLMVDLSELKPIFKRY